MNKDPEKDVADCSIAVLEADEEVVRLKTAMAAARTHADWCRVQLKASTLALRSSRLVGGLRSPGATPTLLSSKAKR